MRNNFAYSLLFGALTSLAAAYEMDKMAFAYHQVRHGARAPKSFDHLKHIVDDINSFPGETSMLTPQGMR